MRPLPLLAVLLLIAGCVTPAAKVPASPAPTSAAIAGVVAPKIDANKTLSDLKTFAEAYPYRQSDTPNHLSARDTLAKSFKDAGLEVVRQSFDSKFFRGIPAPVTGENIIGIKWGAVRDHWVVVGAHYDVTEGAVYGMYDDGSGTMLVSELGQAFAKTLTNRTIAFIEFDQEERGLVGSHAFVQSVTDGSFQYPVTIDAMIDLDMVGITWPHPAHLICWENSDDAKGIVANLTKAVGIPDSNLEFRTPHGGSSDGASFIAADIPTAYFWSDWDDVTLKDGTKVPASYPFWHQADTYQSMVQLAGDEATLTAGFQTTLDVVSPLLVKFANGPEMLVSDPAKK